MSWDPVYIPDIDNPVTGYRLIYRDTSGKVYTNELGPKQSTVHLTGLLKFSTYTITVSAMTEAGSGRTSEPITIVTLEDG